MTKIIEYRSCKIYYNPSSGPNHDCDYDWVHNDFSGATDQRYGYCPNVEACKEDIDEVLND